MFWYFGMERYFEAGRTDLVLFPLWHISRQDLLNKIKILNDNDEVAVLSAVSCLMQTNLTSTQLF